MAPIAPLRATRVQPAICPEYLLVQSLDIRLIGKSPFGQAVTMHKLMNLAPALTLAPLAEPGNTGLYLSNGKSGFDDEIGILRLKS